MTWHPADQRRLEQIVANPEGREALKALLTEDAPVKAAAFKIKRFGWPYRQNAEAAAKVMLPAAVDALDSPEGNT